MSRDNLQIFQTEWKAGVIGFNDHIFDIVSAFT